MITYSYKQFSSGSAAKNCSYSLYTDQKLYQLKKICYKN